MEPTIRVLGRMTPEERLAFGVTEEQQREISDWVMARLGSVIGADGRGGTGTFIELQDGKTALLTARHVVMKCILTGQMTVARLESGVYSVEPSAIIIDSRKDAALLVFENGAFPGATIPYAEWSGRDPAITEGMRVIMSGIVGEWKHPNISTRTIPIVPCLNFWTTVSDPENPRGYLVCDVNEETSLLPTSFGGMSGGPCFSLDRRLLGVNTHEMRRKAGTNQGEFFVTPLAALDNLFQPYVPSSDSPTDYMQQKAFLAFLAVSQNDKHQRVFVMAHVEYFWSPSNLDHWDGRVGRIIGLHFEAPEGTARYFINTKSIFRWNDGNTDEDRLRALYEELEFFLPDTGFEWA